MAGVASLSSGWGILPVPTCVEWRAGTGGARKPLRGLSCFRSGWYIRAHAARILDALKVGRSARAVSVKVMSDVWAHSTQKGSSLLILLAIADNADDSGIAWPSEELIAKKARMSERQVRRVVHEIAATGELAITVRRTGRSTHNVYRVLVSPGQVVLLNGDSPGQIGAVHPDIAMSAEPSVTIKGPREPNGSLAASPKTQERKPRARDPIWDTLVDLFGGEAAGLERGRWNKACQSLKASGATPETLRGAAEAYRTVMPDGTVMTPTALAANWTILTGEAKTADEFQAERIRALVAEVDARNGFQ